MEEHTLVLGALTMQRQRIQNIHWLNETLLSSAPKHSFIPCPKIKTITLFYYLYQIQNNVTIYWQIIVLCYQIQNLFSSISFHRRYTKLFQFCEILPFNLCFVKVIYNVTYNTNLYSNLEITKLYAQIYILKKK